MRFLSLVAALPVAFAGPVIRQNGGSCANGMTGSDCGLLARLGLAVGFNNNNKGGPAWVGEGGPFSFKFTNDSPGPLTVVFNHILNLQQQFDKKPVITYSLPNHGDHVTISVAENVNGTFAAVYPDTPSLQISGLVDNTLGEFSTAGVFTFDVSRLVNTQGHKMVIKSAACEANMDVCAYKCKDPTLPSCWQAGTYYIDRSLCAGADTDNNGQPGGGCKDWTGKGRNVQVSLG